MRVTRWLAVMVVGFAQTCCRAEDRAAVEFFEKKIRPLLAKHCDECHSHDKAGDSGQLAVDSRAALLKGGDRGPIIVSGKPDESLLLKAVKYGDPKLQMPPEGKLPDAEIELLSRWIADGAFVPEYGSALEAKRTGIDWTAARQFWSVRPLERVAIPEARISELGAQIENKTNDDAPPSHSALRAPSSALTNPIDSFITAKLIENGLAPSPAADKRTLIRRVTFDLIGLPPTVDDVAEFLADDSPDAYERLVDRLLASPHFGERWARAWLDMTRYVDEAPDWQKNADGAWLYRDWIVRAFNEDLPFDQFVRLQLAADLMPDANPRDIAALGFLGLSPTYWKELRLAPSVIEVIAADEWDERLDTVTRTFLGLTVACARCHDHKFDPITTRDYYALAGVFASIDLTDRPLLPLEQSEQVKAARRQVDTLNEALKKVKDKESDEAKQLQQQMADIRLATPQFDAPLAPAIEEASVFVVPDGPDATKLDVRRQQPRDLPVFRRGNPGNPGDIVPRGFLELFAQTEPRRFQHGSGRLELAEALLNDAAPLTARVLVNRIWSQHYGKGLVRTPGDFGQQGERPSHPELLDWMAGEVFSVRFSVFSQGTSSSTSVATLPEHRKRNTENSSLKRLHRLLVTSATYRQQSSPSSISQSEIRNPQSVDPDNHLLWRANRRRLEIEPWRDAMLAVAGELDDSLGGRAVDFDAASNRRRTLYGRVGREEQPDLLKLFDFPPPTNHSPSRDVTTTPLQQLFVLNSQFVETRSAAVVDQLPKAPAADRITTAYQRLFQRPPTANELRIGTAFLTEATPARWQTYVKSLLGLNEFLFVD